MDRDLARFEGISKKQVRKTGERNLMRELEIVKSPDTLRQERIPPNQRKTDDFPVLHYGQIPGIDTQHWKFSISGLVEKEVVLTFQEFMALPRVRVFSDIHCVTGWSRLDNLWEGVSTSLVKDLAKILPQAGFVMVHGANDFTTNLSLEDFFQPDVLFALKHNHQRSRPRPRVPRAPGGPQALLLEERQVVDRHRIHGGRPAGVLGIERLPHAREPLAGRALRRLRDFLQPA